MSKIDEVVRLRSPEPKDAKTIYKWENNTENWQYGSLFAPVSLSKIENFIRNFNNDIFAEKQHRFMIDLYTTGMPPKTIGTIDLYDLDAINRRVGVGILIDKKYRNKGFAKQALSITIKYCKDVLNLVQMYCYIISDNESSINLFKSVGFSESGLLKKWNIINSKPHDTVVMQLLLNEKL